MKDSQVMTKWGILGTGRVARNFVSALNFLPNSIPIAVGSRDIERAISFSNEFGIERAYSSYQSLVEDNDIDIVYISTPTIRHYEDIKLCLNSNKNVLCEKPITINANQLDNVAKLAKSKNLFLMEAMWMKCMPSFLLAKNWIEDGKIGKVRFIKVDFTNLMNISEQERFFRADLGGGAILDMGIYNVNFVLAFLGSKVKNVKSNAFIGRTGVDFDTAVLLEYEDAFASMVVGIDIENQKKATIVGEKGKIIFGYRFFCATEIELYDDMNNLVEKRILPYVHNGFEYEILEAEKCVKHKMGDSSLVPIGESIKALMIIDECRKDWQYFFDGELLE